MAVEMPLGGYYRVGRWVPLSCLLTNQGPPAEVKVTAQMRDYGQNPTLDTYELSVALPSPANRRYSLYIMPPAAYAPRPLELQLHQGRQVIGKQEQALKMLNPEDRLIAVIAAEEGGFGGLSGTKVPQQGRPRPGYAPSGPNQGQVQVQYVKPELAPDRMIGYQIADMVILSGVPSGSLSPAQETALLRWVQAGGRLVITGGADPGAFQSPTMKALLPVQITGTVTLDSVGALATRSLFSPLLAGEGQGEGFPPSGRFVALASRPKPGARMIEARPGVPMLASWAVGAGQVVFLAADPTRPPLRGWETLTGLWRAALLQSSPETHFLSAIDMANQMGTPGYYNPYGAPQPVLANACLQVSQMDVPGFAFIGLFLLSYIIVLVPVNYMVLKRRDRRELAWVTTPGIVLAFSVLAYLVGYGTKGGNVLLAHVAVVEAWAGRRAAPALTYVGLFSPRKTRYDLATEDGAVPLMAAPTGGQEGRRLRVVEGESFTLKDVSVDMWDMSVFRGDTVVELGEGFQCDLKVVDGQLVGKVTNRTPFDLENVALLSGGGRAALWGMFKRGETRTVTAAWSPGATGGVLPPAALETVRGTGAPSRMRRALIEPLTTWGPAGYGGQTWPTVSHPVLMGWVSRPLVPARVDGRAVREQAAQLFLVHLPLKE